MPRHRRYEPLNVLLNSRLVGQLRRSPSGAISFQYDGSWLAWEHTMPVSLSLPLQEDAYSGAPVRAVFENLLPDNDELRRRIAAHAHAEGTDAYSLLSAIGHDCVGALQFLPRNASPARRAHSMRHPSVQAKLPEFSITLPPLRSESLRMKSSGSRLRAPRKRRRCYDGSRHGTSREEPRLPPTSSNPPLDGFPTESI